MSGASLGSAKWYICRYDLAQWSEGQILLHNTGMETQWCNFPIPLCKCDAIFDAGYKKNIAHERWSLMQQNNMMLANSVLD